MAGQTTNEDGKRRVAVIGLSVVGYGMALSLMHVAEVVGYDPDLRAIQRFAPGGAAIATRSAKAAQPVS